MAATQKFFQEVFGDQALGMDVKVDTAFQTLDPRVDPTRGETWDIKSPKLGFIKKMDLQNRVIKFLHMVFSSIHIPLMKKGEDFMPWVVKALDMLIAVVEDNRAAPRSDQLDALIKSSMRCAKGLLRAI